jgi:hypothetical protein
MEDVQPEPVARRRRRPWYAPQFLVFDSPPDEDLSRPEFSAGRYWRKAHCEARSARIDECGATSWRFAIRTIDIGRNVGWASLQGGKALARECVFPELAIEQAGVLLAPMPAVGTKTCFRWTEFQRRCGILRLLRPCVSAQAPEHEIPLI